MAERLPKLSRHRGRNLAYVTDPRTGREVYLGPWGSAESVARYDAWCREFSAWRKGEPGPLRNRISPLSRLTLPQIMEGLRAYAAEVYPGSLPVELRIILDGGRRIVLPVPAVMLTPVPDPDAEIPVMPAARRALPMRRHSPDFASVSWDGDDYSFTGARATVVKLLWEAWEAGTPDLGAAYLLEASGSQAVRMADVFKDDPAWGAFVIHHPAAAKGTFRLDI